MKIEKVITGFLEANCYILKDEKTKKCLVIDPGDDYKKIKEQIKDYKVLKVLLTHSHFDHVGALRQILNEYHTQVLKKENLDEKEQILDNFIFKVIYTPGHSSDSITFYFEKEKVMFTGDFLFQGTIGRTDLPTGNTKEMVNSIEKIKKYNPEITIYPGHGDTSTLKEEFENNIYFIK